MSDVKWPIKGTTLVKCPAKKELLKVFNRDELELFERNVNVKIVETANHIAPACLQYGGFVFGVMIMIAACIVVTSDSDSVLGGLLMFALGIIVLGGAFWYRDQLHQRKWKNIAQQLQAYFKEISRRHPGLQLEFHIQGHHTATVREVKPEKSRGKKGKGKKGKGKKERKQERTMVWYERYIVISIPYDDYVPTKEQVDRSRGVKNNDAYRKYETEEAVEDEAYVQNAPPKAEVGATGVVSLPYWWVRAKDEDDRVYYINNFKKKTQWKAPSAGQIEKERAEMSSVLAPPPYDSRSKSAGRFNEVKRKSLIRKRSIIKQRRASKRITVQPESNNQNDGNQEEEEDKIRENKRQKTEERKSKKRKQNRGDKRSKDNNSSTSGNRSREGGNRRSKKRSDRGDSRRNDSSGGGRGYDNNYRSGRNENRRGGDRGDRNRRNQRKNSRNSNRNDRQRDNENNQIH